MKNTAPFFVAFTSFFSLCIFAQPSKEILPNALNENKEFVADNSELTIADIESYRVEERINMTFNGRITTDEVSTLSLVSTNDLGPNNVRLVTPKYVKAKPVVKNKIAIQLIKVDAKKLKPTCVDLVIPQKKKDYLEIDLARSYERILEKGYQSIDMLYIVANRRFFDSDLEIAAKWYAKLFELSKDVDSVHNYRFAQCLKATGQSEKASQMMSLFESKSNSK
jgi:hypothetical protein